MTYNIFGKCKVCGCRIRLRCETIRIINVNLYCPKCSSHLSGTIMTNKEGQKRTALILNYDEDDEDILEGFTLELSDSFLTRKCLPYNENNKFLPTPFISAQLFNEEKIKRFQNILYLSEFSFKYSVWLETLFNLLFYKKQAYIVDYMFSLENPYSISLNKDASFKEIKNELDSLICTKYYVTASMQCLISKEVYSHLVNVQKYVSDIYLKFTKETLYFLKFLNHSEYFLYYYRKIPAFFCQYLNLLPQFVPIYSNIQDENYCEIIKRGITTLDIEKAHSFYSKGFELLCDSIDIFAGLFNVESGREYDNFGSGRKSFDDEMNKYQSKFQKYNCISTLSPFLGKYLNGVLNNIVRNSEAHNSFEINGVDQEITFVNKHKGVKRIEKYSFVELGIKCIDLYSALVVVWEFYYQLLKFKMMFVDKMRPNYAETFYKNITNTNK